MYFQKLIKVFKYYLKQCWVVWLSHAYNQFLSFSIKLSLLLEHSSYGQMFMAYNFIQGQNHTVVMCTPLFAIFMVISSFLIILSLEVVLNFFLHALEFVLGIKVFFFFARFYMTYDLGVEKFLQIELIAFDIYRNKQILSS